MILVTNGCSFTSGVPDPKYVINTKTYTDQWLEGELSIDNFKSFYQYVPYAWPFTVKSDRTVNLGLQGASNYRILRTTMDFLNKVSTDTLKECVFVICWTMCNRKEYWYKNVPFRTEPTMPEHYMVMRPQLEHNPDNFYTDIDLNSWMPEQDHEKLPPLINEFELHTGSMSKDIYDTLIQMVALKHLFKSYNVDRYLYTSLFWQGTGIDCADDNFSGYTDWHKPLLNVLQDDHLVKDTESVISESSYFSDGHPDKTGNNEFGSYIQQQLEERNWLT